MIGTILITAACIGHGVLLALKMQMLRRLTEIESPILKNRCE